MIGGFPDMTDDLKSLIENKSFTGDDATHEFAQVYMALHPNSPLSKKQMHKRYKQLKHDLYQLWCEQGQKKYDTHLSKVFQREIPSYCHYQFAAGWNMLHIYTTRKSLIEHTLTFYLIGPQAQQAKALAKQPKSDLFSQLNQNHKLRPCHSKSIRQ